MPSLSIRLNFTGSTTRVNTPGTPILSQAFAALEPIAKKNEQPESKRIAV